MQLVERKRGNFVEYPDQWTCGQVLVDERDICIGMPL